MTKKISHYFNAFRYRIWKIFKSRIDKKRRIAFTNSGVSIISMNCTGGILYHDLGQEFLSPTINMFIKARDFIKLCENLEYYLSIDNLKEVNNEELPEKYDFPIAKLEDLTLYFMHYKSFQEAKEKWNERKKRVNYEKIVVIACDRDGMSPDLIERFSHLPYKKVMFVHKPINDVDDCIVIPGYENEPQVGVVTDNKGWKGLRPIDEFDWVSFLNKA